ncbi:MAG: hypothetical protein ABIS38_03125 [Sphingomicrobium sp.]
MSRSAIHQLFACAALLSWSTAAAAANAPDPVEQLELEGGWSGEAIVDVGHGSEFQLYRSIGDGVALGFEVESEGTAVEHLGVGALIGVADDLGLLVQLDADARGRPSEASALLIAEVQRGPWSATANLALRHGWRGEFAGPALDYAWGLRAAVTRRVAVGVEGAGRMAASETRRAEGPGHFFGMGVVLTPRTRGATTPEFGILLLREASVSNSPVLLRASVQLNLAHPPRAQRSEEDKR